MKPPCRYSFETLLDYHDGRLDSVARQEIATHLADGCPACNEELRWMTSTLPSLSEAFQPERLPSLQARENVRRLARLLPQPAPQPAGWTRFVAHLLSGGAAPLSFAGARGSTLSSVQQVYGTEAHVVTLWEEIEAPRNHYLIGQVYERGGALLFPKHVVLVSSDATERKAIQEGSEFHLSDVAPGTYAICCRFEGSEVVLPDVEVGAP